MELFGGAFALFFLSAMALTFVPLVFWVVSLVEIGRAPEQAFGPPWDNTRTMWLIGLAVSAIVPFGILVTTVLWWTQGHSALKQGAQVPRPFWAPRPSYPYGQPPQPPQPYGQPPQPPVTPPG